MTRCRHCGIQIGPAPFVRDGVRYYCKRSAFDPQVVVMLNQHRESFAALLKELKNTPAVTLDAAALAQDVRRVQYNR